MLERVQIVWWSDLVPRLRRFARRIAGEWLTFHWGRPWPPPCLLRTHGAHGRPFFLSYRCGPIEVRIWDKSATPKP